MGKFRGFDTDEGWIKRRFLKIEKEMREDRAAKRLASSTIQAGGSLLVRGFLNVLGTVSMKSADGFELFRLGDMEFGRGLEFKRDDGSSILTIRKPFSDIDQQRWGLHDRNDQAVVSEDGLGPGLGRPSLQLPFQPIYPASGTAVLGGPYGIERSTTSGTFQTLFAYDGRAQNFLLDFKFMAMCSDGTTAGEIQVADLDTGLPLTGYLAGAWTGVVPTGTTTMTAVDPTSTQIVSTVGTVGMGGQMRLGVQCRRTAGAGTITLVVAQAMGG